MCYGCHLIRAQVIIVQMNNGDLSVISRNVLERTQFVTKDGNCLIWLYGFNKGVSKPNQSSVTVSVISGEEQALQKINGRSGLRQIFSEECISEAQTNSKSSTASSRGTKKGNTSGKTWSHIVTFLRLISKSILRFSGQASVVKLLIMYI